jgi:hypothetical protein
MTSKVTFVSSWGNKLIAEPKDNNTFGMLSLNMVMLLAVCAKHL